jgi:hypothetical protein
MVVLVSLSTPEPTARVHTSTYIIPSSPPSEPRALHYSVVHDIIHGGAKWRNVVWKINALTTITITCTGRPFKVFPNTTCMINYPVVWQPSDRGRIRNKINMGKCRYKDRASGTILVQKPLRLRAVSNDMGRNRGIQNWQSGRGKRRRKRGTTRGPPKRSRGRRLWRILCKRRKRHNITIWDKSVGVGRESWTARGP